MSELILALFLLLLVAIFASGETALFFLSSKKNYSFKPVLRILKNPYLLLNTVLLGNTLFSILFSNILEEILSHNVFDFIHYEHIKVAAVIFVTTLLVLILGEVLPKNIALFYPEPVAKITVFPLSFMKKIFYPLTFLLYRMTQYLIKRWGEQKGPHFTKNEIRQIITLSHEKGVLQKDETELIQKIINFSHTEIRNLMIPRKDLLAVSSSEPLGKAWSFMKEHNASKVLVYHNNIDNITGFIHLKDLLTRQEELNTPIGKIKKLIREAHFVPESKSPAQCLKILRQKKVSFIIVLDEYGGTSGVVTLNRIMKTIMGSSLEEKNMSRKHCLVISPNEIIVNGNYFNFRELKDFFKIEEDLPDGEERIASFILEKMEHLPESGEKLNAFGLEWEVLEVKENSIVRVRIKKTA